jgi:MFS transporter, putative metabolite:H+ symporter
VVLTCIATFWTFGINLTLYLYTTEIYPTRMRALGTSWATFWLRFASIIGPIVVGSILPLYSIAGVFLFYAIISLIGGAVCWWGAIEAKGRVLEEISP